MVRDIKTMAMSAMLVPVVAWADVVVAATYTMNKLQLGLYQKRKSK